MNVCCVSGVTGSDPDLIMSIIAMRCLLVVFLHLLLLRVLLLLLLPLLLLLLLVLVHSHLNPGDERSKSLDRVALPRPV